MTLRSLQNEIGAVHLFIVQSIALFLHKFNTIGEQQWLRIRLKVVKGVLKDELKCFVRNRSSVVK